MLFILMSHAGLLVVQPDLRMTSFGADVVMLMSHAGLLVVQPDVLLSGTRVAGSFKCARQAVLEERFGGDSGAKAVEGTLLHELFQVRPEGYHPLSGHAR